MAGGTPDPPVTQEVLDAVEYVNELYRTSRGLEGADEKETAV